MLNRCRIPAIALLAALLLSPPGTTAAEAVDTADPVKSELLQNECWVGEPVTMLITLYSPGPFSGTARFDLPELPQTVILSAGAPLIGTDEIDGDTWFTQRHEFRVFTQRAGTTTIPPFNVRFSGKPTFTADPEPFEARTESLTFESQRPPGTTPEEIVVAADDIRVEQTWQPDDQRTLSEGDVVIRTVTRTAENTSAMMLPPVAASETTAVQVYPGTPELQDQTERGGFTARRVDTLKYQFRAAGTQQLPELTFTWWDVSAKTVRTATLEGRDFQIQPVAAVAETEADSADETSSVPWLWIGLFGGAASVICVVFRHALGKYVTPSPEQRAARALIRACDRNETENACRALIGWKRIVEQSSCLRLTEAAAHRRELDAAEAELNALLFQKNRVPSTWCGNRLKAAFVAFRAEIKEHHRRQERTAALSPLNP